jgi:hypothetical protein
VYAFTVAAVGFTAFIPDVFVIVVYQLFVDADFESVDRLRAVSG